MLRAMKYLLAVATLLSLTSPARAQKVDFEVGAPGVVAVGEAFRIEFTVNAKPDGFTPPAFGGFDVLAGPTTSEGTARPPPLILMLRCKYTLFFRPLQYLRVIFR